MAASHFWSSRNFCSSPDDLVVIDALRPARGSWNCGGAAPGLTSYLPRNRSKSASNAPMRSLKLRNLRRGKLVVRFQEDRVKPETPQASKMGLWTA